MIFRRDRKRKGSAEELEEVLEDAETEATDEDTADLADEEDLAALDALDWRTDGPWDVSEVEDPDSTQSGPQIDLGSLIIPALAGSELRLQVAEETKEIVSAMLVIQTRIPASRSQRTNPAGGAVIMKATVRNVMPAKRPPVTTSGKRLPPRLATRSPTPPISGAKVAPASTR